jgi:hypothetical protein
MKRIIAVFILLVIFASAEIAASGEADHRFIAREDETVVDARTGLMWASRDNGKDISWQEAKSYCENYRGGGYTDWRMPTRDELAGLYDENKNYPTDCGWPVHATNLIHLTCSWVWSSETRGFAAYYLYFENGGQFTLPQSLSNRFRALPVRTVK